ncbi:uncharacterized protein LOC133954119 isoform X2 [Platichthys flesus]|uniref:uncharacterized protein LOC133954119 isoform X2 n=1 Tax=Platichthys flesus TaxID=8260 RepID=UPI002DBC9A9E|nr:uncharacterized protein LOC133954119 isoform X2 [Platichthys flesus]
MEEVDITTTCESVALHSFRCLAARTRTPDEFKVSQGDATEKLAHQVAAPVAAAHRRVEEASEPAVECPTSPESSPGTGVSVDMEEEEEEEEERERPLPQRRTQTQEPQNRSKPENKAQRSRPPD